MSDLLTHWAVYEDLRRIAAIDAGMEPTLSRVVNEETLAGRLGALSRGGHRWCGQLFRSIRPDWDEGHKRMRQKLAYALGGIAHYPADIHMKPMTQRTSQAAYALEHPDEELAQEPGVKRPQYFREASAYYDTHVFRKVYADGAEEPFNQFLYLLAPNNTVPGMALEEFVRVLFQRALLSSHTLAPSKENAPDWLDKLFDLLQPLYIDIDLYVDVYANPNPKKMEIYEVESHFYIDDDPAIVLARKMQQGEDVTQAELDTALSHGTNGSAYGMILELGVSRMRETSRWWCGDADELPDIRQG